MIAWKNKPQKGCFYDERKGELRSYPSAVDTNAEIIDILEFKDKAEQIFIYQLCHLIAFYFLNFHKNKINSIMSTFKRLIQLILVWFKNIWSNEERISESQCICSRKARVSFISVISDISNSSPCYYPWTKLELIRKFSLEMSGKYIGKTTDTSHTIRICC